MHLIYSGGYDKLSKKSVKNSFIYTFLPYLIKFKEAGKNIAFVTLAKPDGNFDDKIFPYYSNIVDIIDYTKIHSVKWITYDAIFIFGGDPVKLLDGLKESRFGLNQLKKEAIILGDSAGSYLLSTYFYNSPPGELRGEKIEFLEGFNPHAKIITVAHRNNSVFCNDKLLKKVNTFAKNKKLSVLILNENEQKLLRGNRLIDIDKTKLFGV